MDIIYTDKNGVEIGFLPDDITADIDIGDSDDFELISPNNILEENSKIYCADTEIGGIIKRITSDTETGEIRYGGFTFRGMIKNKIIEPLSGDNYRTVVNKTVGEVISGFLTEFELNSLFTAETNSTNIAYFQFERYCTLYDGLTKMLAEKGLKLSFAFKLSDKKVHIKATPIVDYSDTDELSQDGNINMEITLKRDGVNHLICLGGGELAERTVIHLYLQGDGTIGNTKFYTGIDEITATYDFSSCADEELEEKGKDQFKELRSADNIEVTVSDDASYELYDKISGKDYKTGIVVNVRVTNIVIRIENGTIKKEYKVEEYEL